MRTRFAQLRDLVDDNIHALVAGVQRADGEHDRPVEGKSEAFSCALDLFLAERRPERSEIEAVRQKRVA